MPHTLGIYSTRNTCIAEPREAREGEGAHKGGGGGREKGEVNHVTGECRSNIGS